MGSIPGSGRSPGRGHSNPLQYSCLENPMDRGAWWATVHGATQSQTQPKRLSMQACYYLIWGIIPVLYSKSFLLICFMLAVSFFPPFCHPLCTPAPPVQSDLRVNGEQHSLSPPRSCCQFLAAGITILSTARARVSCAPHPFFLSPSHSFPVSSDPFLGTLINHDAFLLEF